MAPQQQSENATRPRGRASAGPSAPRWTQDPNFSRPDGALGVDPSEMVGKVLTSIRRSAAHPALTLHFADRTAYQVRIDGYSPAHPGVPKQLEINMDLETLLASIESGGSRALTFASGSAATASLLQSLGPGAHVLSIDDVYGGTNRYMRRVAAEVQGLVVDFLDLALGGGSISDNATFGASPPNVRPSCTTFRRH